MHSHQLQKNQLNQNCAELALIQAASIVLGTRIEFNYPSSANDVQVDISPAFMVSDGESTLLTSGNSAEALQQDLARLDKKKSFIIRTGINNGAGHWRFLHFDAKTQTWIMCSPTNQYQMTNAAQQLTDVAIHDLIKPFGKWGQADGENSILLQEATQTRVMNCANYLYDLRTLKNAGEALEKLYATMNTNKFHDQLNPVALSPTPVTPIEPVVEPIKITSNTEEQLREKINPLIKTLTTETNRLKKSCFSFLFRFEINTKQKKIAALTDILGASNLTEMRTLAANYQKNSRVMRNMKTDRTRKLINEITVIERTTFKL